MRPRLARNAAALLVSAVLAGACGGGPSDSPQPANPSASAHHDHHSPSGGSASATPSKAGRIINVTVRDGKVTPDPGRVEVKVGEKIRIEVTSDRNDEVHVHAYEKRAAISAGETAVLEFVADIPGTFEVELESAKLRLFDLRVS